MNIAQALNILKPESNTMDSLKTAYRAACKKYHPDLNPDGLELMKVINAAPPRPTPETGHNPKREKGVKP